MDKPLTVAYEEMKSSIINLINETTLPVFMLEPIFKDFLTEIREVAKNQYEYDMNQYAQYLASQNEAEQSVVDEPVYSEEKEE